MTQQTLPPDDDDGELAPWEDPTPYSPRTPGSDYWLGTEGDFFEQGPFRGWWIRRLYSHAQVHAPDADDEVWSRMALWLAEAGADTGYVRFRTAEHFEPGRSTGYWVVNDQAIVKDLPKAFAWATQAVGASPPTLEEVMQDPGRGLTVAPREPSAPELLPPEARDRWWGTVPNLRRRWPRNCRVCGKSFRPKTSSAVHCESCRAERREKGGAYAKR